MKKYAEKTDACKCGHRFFCAEKTACRRLTNQLGFVFPTVGAIHESPADFDVILRNGQDRSLRTKNHSSVGVGEIPLLG